MNKTTPKENIDYVIKIVFIGYESRRQTQLKLTLVNPIAGPFPRQHTENRKPQELMIALAGACRLRITNRLDALDDFNGVDANWILYSAWSQVQCQLTSIFQINHTI